MAAGNNIIGEVGLKVVPIDPNAQFQAGVDQIIKRLEKQAQFQVKASGLEQVEQQANSAGQAFASAAIQAAGLTAAIYGIKAAVEGAIGKLSGLFDQLAQARAGFTSILHSEAAGGQLLDDIREFARISPFVTQELVNYSQQLLGVGLASEKIIPLLKSTGDIISSVGGDTTNLGRVLFTLTQIKSIGVLKGQDTMQLQNSLIPITKYLSEYLKKSASEIVKLREDGKITAEVVFAALNQQGEKVKGAMDKATRNIAGARAILSDTIIQLFQDQPVLDRIFKDVFTSIANLASKLGEAEFQQAFQQFFDGVEKVYEGLVPLLTALSGLVNEGVISGLQVFGSTLGYIGEVLSAIPEPAMEAIARLFLALATLKAPLLLITYITSIQRMAAAILPATTNLSKMGTALQVTAQETNAATLANQRYIASLVAAGKVSGAGVGLAAGAPAKKGFLARHASGAVLAGSLAATIGGGYLSQSKNDTVGVLGGGLQGAGVGAQIGMIAGPEGAAVGAVVGAAVGAVTSFLGRADAVIKKHIEEMKKLGEDDATAFIDATAKKFGDKASGDSFKAYATQINLVQAELKVLTDERDKAQKVVDNLDIGFKIEDSAKIQGITTELERLQQVASAAFDPITYGLDQVLAGLDKTSAGYIAFTKSAASGQGKGRGGFGSGEGRVAQTDMAINAEEAKKYGFELDQLGSADQVEALIQLIKVWDGLTTAQQNATAAANKYNTTYDAGLSAAAAIYDPQKKQITTQISNIKALDDAQQAQLVAGNKSADLAAKEAAFNASKVEYANAYTAAILAGKDAQEAALLGNIAADKVFRDLQVDHDVARNNAAIAKKRENANANDPANLGNATDFNMFDNQEAQRKENERIAKEAADKAAADAEKAAADALAFAEKVKSSTQSLVDRLEGAAENIAAAAETWVHSIKERTQFESSISAGRAISNTQKQIKEVVELAAGIAELKARGLSDEAIKSLGIDNVSDLKQVRKLLKANPNDLTTLSAGVSELTQKSIDLATSQEDARTQKNIAEGILAAATELGIDVSKGEATSLAGSFEFNINSDPEAIAAAILGFLTKGVTG